VRILLRAARYTAASLLAALVARRSWSAACLFWIEMEDLVLFADVACGWWLLACSFFSLAMLARREAVAML
jgi:hypothetical protein